MTWEPQPKPKSEVHRRSVGVIKREERSVSVRSLPLVDTHRVPEVLSRVSQVTEQIIVYDRNFVGSTDSPILLNRLNPHPGWEWGPRSWWIRCVRSSPVSYWQVSPKRRDVHGLLFKCLSSSVPDTLFWLVLLGVVREVPSRVFISVSSWILLKVIEGSCGCFWSTVLVVLILVTYNRVTLHEGSEGSALLLKRKSLVLNVQSLYTVLRSLFEIRVLLLETTKSGRPPLTCDPQ